MYGSAETGYGQEELIDGRKVTGQDADPVTPGMKAIGKGTKTDGDGEEDAGKPDAAGSGNSKK
jgi:hypothetical protein